MIYKNFQDKQLSLLGFGTMRFPLLEDGNIDEVQVEAMVDYAMNHGVNYFDTAWPYHSGKSRARNRTHSQQISTGKFLSG